MIKEQALTYALLHELFDYDSVAGGLVWRINKNRARIGMRAGWVDQLGYRSVGINKRRYKEHRLVWAWHGRAEEKELDHINGDSQDNRIENLRRATRAENMWNTGVRKDNRAGVKGIGFKRGRWRARLQVNKKPVHVGTFDTREEAEAAITAARKDLHRCYAKHL
jgi:hypothetical protein